MRNTTTAAAVHYWSDAATLPTPGTLAPYAVCATNPTTRSKFTNDKAAVTCAHCRRLLVLRDPCCTSMESDGTCRDCGPGRAAVQS